MAFILANTRGRLHPADEPSITPLDRGFLYGDAIYEVWRTYEGVIFGFVEHWQRLERSAAALHFPLPFNREQLLAELVRTAAEFRRRAALPATELYLRLQISRGAGAIGLDIALADEPCWVIIVQSLKVAADPWGQPVRLSLARTLHRNPIDALNPAWKTGNYLNNLLCLREARARGADEVLITNHAGRITECAVCNFAVVRDGVFETPAVTDGILCGITRDLVLREVAPRAGVPAREASFTPADLGSCQEAIILSSTRDVAPVAAVDQQEFPVSKDSVTGRLKRAFLDYTHDYARAHPEQRA